MFSLKYDLAEWMCATNATEKEQRANVVKEENVLIIDVAKKLCFLVKEFFNNISSYVLTLSPPLVFLKCQS